MEAASTHEDGLYFDLSSDKYHADMALGSSNLKDLMYDPALFWFQSHFNPLRPERADSKAQMIGTAVHTMVLDGVEAFKARYRPAPGNCRVAARVVEINTAQKYIEADAVFHDLESNAATSARVQRRISDSKGRLYSAAMIQQTGNAACSIARRNAILAGVPRALWRPAYEAARHMLVGDAKAIANTRAEAVKAFTRLGVTPEQLFAVLGVNAETDLTADHIVTLRGMFATLRNGEASVEEMFSPARAVHQVVANPLDDRAVEKPAEASDDVPATAANMGGETSTAAGSGPAGRKPRRMAGA